MSLLDRLKDAAHKIIPEKKDVIAVPMSSTTGGIGRGIVPFDDDMPISKPAIVFHATQIFFSFLAMCCFASVASFQAKWDVGPSGLTGFAIFCAVSNIVLSLFLLFVPVLYDKYNKFVRLARALKELRVAFILTGAGVAELLLISFIATISSWTQPGCKNADNDPNAKKGGDDYKAQLPGWCRTKKAGSIFFWLGTAFWIASFVLVVLDWRSGKSGVRPRDPPFTHPREDDAESIISRPTRRSSRRDEDDDEDGELESPFADRHQFHAPTGRASMEAYGAFSDPPPSGYPTNPAATQRTSTAPTYYSAPAASSPPPRLPALSSSMPPPQSSPPKFQTTALPQSQAMSRTMALAYEDTGTTATTYEDPYDKVRASLGAARSSPVGPPGYDYRP